MNQLEFCNVSYCPGGKKVLDAVSLAVAAGNYLAVTGPSGSGKSTFLRLCGCLASPTGGSILYDGVDMAGQDSVAVRRRIGFCFQTPILFGDTVEDNLIYPYYVRRQKVDRMRIVKLLELFNLGGQYLEFPVRNLSGGEKQRIALARALVFRPEILLLDEVTSALDEDNMQTVEQAVAGLHADGVTVIWVTHTPARSRGYADTLLTIENGCVVSQEALK